MTNSPTQKTGIVTKIEFTSGGAGNQWTTIDQTKYATWWDIRTSDWRVGDRVTFEGYSAPLWSGAFPVACAQSIRKARS